MWNDECGYLLACWERYRSCCQGVSNTRRVGKTGLTSLTLDSTVALERWSARWGETY